MKERIKVMNAFVRQFLISWITVLDSVPDIELLDPPPPPKHRQIQTVWFQQDVE